MLVRPVRLTLLEKNWLTPTVLMLRLEPNHRIPFLPGQFLSLYVPSGDRTVRRAYSFTNSPESAKKLGVELTIKILEDGQSSQFLKSLKPGDTLRATAPYGDFHIQTTDPARNLVWICTGTGIGPLRSHLQSKEFEENRPDRVTLIFGAQNHQELLFRKELEDKNISIVYAVSSPHDEIVKFGNSMEFHGRVTDYMRSLPNDWPWHQTDFYLCGHPDMIVEVRHILMAGHGVPEKSVHQEIFHSSGMTALRKVA